MAVIAKSCLMMPHYRRTATTKTEIGFLKCPAVSKYHSQWQKPRKSKRLDRQWRKISAPKKPAIFTVAGISTKLVELHGICQMDFHRDCLATTLSGNRRNFEAFDGRNAKRLQRRTSSPTFKFGSGRIGHKMAGKAGATKRSG
jgi:hypothetical protein